MRRPANIFLIAVVVAAIGAALVYRFLSAQQAELERIRAEAVGEVVDVAVAAHRIEIGTRLQPEHIKIVRWPKDSAPAGAVASPEAVVGKIARGGIRHHQPFLETDLTAESSGIMPLLIEDGMRAISVKVDKVTGVSGFIIPNSRVDVFATGSINDQEGERDERSKLILQNVRVLATGVHIEQQESGVIEVPTVTLLVKPEDAEQLALVARRDPVFLALRGFRDEEAVATEGASLRRIFINGKPPPAPPRAAPAPARAAPPPRQPPSVEVLLGDTRTRQPY